MGSLAPVQQSGISAVYDSAAHQLILEAKGKIPGFLFTPFFKREQDDGSLCFSMRAFAGGLGRQPGEKEFEATEKVDIELPAPGLDDKSIVVETSLGKWNIDIKYADTGAAN